MEIFNTVENLDCMDGMAKWPDNYFDLAIVDPPYYSGPDVHGYYGNRISTTGVQREAYKEVEFWDIPGHSYYEELLRVSKEQIIFGINYFNFAAKVPGRFIWDKCNSNSSFSDAEIASCSLYNSVRIYKYLWNGMMQGSSVYKGHIQRGNKRTNEKRIHPTQKPIDLYRYLLAEYTQPGDRILDTHVGSGSSRIACSMEGRSLYGTEKSPTIYRAQQIRFNAHLSKPTLFNNPKSA